MCKNTVLAAGIRSVSDLDEYECILLQSDTSHLIPINNDHVFDLTTWYESDERSSNRYPEMDAKRFKLFKADIEANGVLEPPVLNSSDLSVVEGRTRLTALYQVRAAEKACPFPGFRIMDFENEAAVHDYQDRSSLQKRQLTSKQKRELIKQALLRHPDYADNHIGAIVQADAGTVKRVSDEMISAGLLERPNERLGLDGRTTAVQVKTKKKPQVQSKCLSPVEQLLQRWFETYSHYPVVAADIAIIMKKENFELPNGKNASMETGDCIRDVGRWLVTAVREGLSFQKHSLISREVRKGQPVYALIPTKFRKIELETTNDKPSLSVSQDRGALSSGISTVKQLDIVDEIPEVSGEEE